MDEDAGVMIANRVRSSSLCVAVAKVALGYKLETVT